MEQRICRVLWTSARSLPPTCTHPLPARTNAGRSISHSPYDPRFDAYESLGLQRTATQGEIKKAFYKLAMDHHPDRAAHSSSPAASKDRFVRINRAYELLGSPDARARYDLERSRYTSAPSAYPSGYGPGRAPYQQGYYDPFGPDMRARRYREEYPTPRPGHRSADARQLWFMLGVFAIAGTSLTLLHVTKMRALVAESMDLKTREALVYYEESRRRALEGKRKALGEDVLEESRRRRKDGSRPGAEAGVSEKKEAVET